MKKRVVFILLFLTIIVLAVCTPKNNENTFHRKKSFSEFLKKNKLQNVLVINDDIETVYFLILADSTDKILYRGTVFKPDSLIFLYKPNEKEINGDIFFNDFWFKRRSLEGEITTFTMHCSFCHHREDLARSGESWLKAKIQNFNYEVKEHFSLPEFTQVQKYKLYNSIIDTLPKE